MTLNREELAWAAGFFDGEGCTSFIQPKSQRAGTVRLHICQNDTRALQRFKKAILGLGTIVLRCESSSSLAKTPIYALSLQNFQHVQAAIAMLWAWLGPVKREQYITALNKKKFQWNNYNG